MDKKVQQYLVFTELSMCFSCLAVREMRFQLMEAVQQV